MTTAKLAPPEQPFLTVVYKTGDSADIALDPLSIYEASEDGHTSPIGLTYAAAWISAGKPEGDLKSWLATVASAVEVQRSVPLKGGTKR